MKNPSWFPLKGGSGIFLAILLAILKFGETVGSVQPFRLQDGMEGEGSPSEVSDGTQFGLMCVSDIHVELDPDKQVLHVLSNNFPYRDSNSKICIFSLFLYMYEFYINSHIDF